MMKRFQDGVLIYEPWYGLLMRPLEVLENYLNLPVTIALDGLSLSEVLGQVVVRIAETGLEITIPIFIVASLLAQKLAGRIYRGVREQGRASVSVSPSASETVT